MGTIMADRRGRAPTVRCAGMQNFDATCRVTCNSFGPRFGKVDTDTCHVHANVRRYVAAVATAAMKGRSKSQATDRRATRAGRKPARWDLGQGNLGQDSDSAQRRGMQIVSSTHCVIHELLVTQLLFASWPRVVGMCMPTCVHMRLSL